MTTKTDIAQIAKLGALQRQKEHPLWHPTTPVSKAAVSKPGSRSDPNEVLKSLSMPDLQVKLGSSPDGLTQAEAQKRLSEPIRSQRNRREEN